MMEWEAVNRRATPYTDQDNSEWTLSLCEMSIKENKEKSCTSSVGPLMENMLPGFSIFFTVMLGLLINRFLSK